MTRSIICREILHGGEGPLGESVEILTCRTDPEYAAREAAAYFAEQEDRADRADGHDHQDDTVRHIAVLPPEGGPHRAFRVRCVVERRFQAEEVEA